MNDANNEYKFIRRLGEETSSSVDLVEDEKGNSLVIKHCKMDNKDAWKEECLKEIAITSSLGEANTNCNFPISHMENIAGEDVMISTLIQGKELSKDVLEKWKRKKDKRKIGFITTGNTIPSQASDVRC